MLKKTGTKKIISVFFEKRIAASCIQVNSFLFLHLYLLWLHLGSIFQTR